MAEEYWITKEGKEIAVGDMDIQHLRNVLRLILRKSRENKELENNGLDGPLYGFWKD